MKNIKLIDPELEPMLQLVPELEFTRENINEIRETGARQFKEMLALMPEIKGVTAEDLTVPGPPDDPEVMVRIYKPKHVDSELPGLLWIHGGGYITGDVEQNDYISRQMVKEVECAVVSVEYRLAPEHPYPAPLEDCYASLRWMHEHAAEQCIDISRIGIGGASAGGGLAAGLALLARDRAEIEVAFQLLIYPMIDDCNIAPASDVLPDTLIWSRKNNLFGWTSYLGENPGGKNVPIYAAPFRAADLTGLPPAFVAVGDIDLFIRENLQYAERLIRAGVPTELHVYPGAYHGFNYFVQDAEISNRCNAEIYQALRSAFSK